MPDGLVAMVHRGGLQRFARRFLLVFRFLIKISFCNFLLPKRASAPAGQLTDHACRLLLPVNSNIILSRSTHVVEQQQEKGNDMNDE